MSSLPGSERRAALLSDARCKLSGVPHSAVALDCETDSLMHKPWRRPVPEVHAPAPNGAEARLTELLGFPHVLALSQGRLAEAVFARAALRPGQCVVGSTLFPTTRIHLERAGATVLDTMLPECLHSDKLDPFKGNLDLAQLGEVLCSEGVRVRCIYVEPCNNAIGGHPVSMQNMRGIHALASHARVPVYLDASRLLDNAVLIREREREFRKTPLLDIVREFCGYATGCTMSATKNFDTPVGGFIATRDRELFELCSQEALLLGTGLNLAGLAQLAHALSAPADALVNVAARVERVREMHAALLPHCSLLSPAGGHAIFLRAPLAPGSSSAHESAERFLNAVFVEHGIRGAINPAWPAAAAPLVRFAIPVFGGAAPILKELPIAIRRTLEGPHRSATPARSDATSSDAGLERARHRSTSTHALTQTEH